ncbi:MAG TPA: hypothetical protein VN647_08870 [Nitrospira sp.]|nr:hypothetical protein [Nitrospira sp.]
MGDDNDSLVPPLSYLLECSETSLRNFLVVNLNKSANIRKKIRGLLEERAECEGLAFIAEWLIEYGPQLLALSGAESLEKEKEQEQNREEKREVIELENSLTERNERIQRQLTLADWRSMTRKWRKRAG